jgi:hypothetical protein
MPGAWIALCDEQSEEIALRRLWASNRNTSNAPVSRSEYAAGRVVQTGEPIYVPIPNDQSFASSIQACGLMIVPLTVHGARSARWDRRVCERLHVRTRARVDIAAGRSPPLLR